MDATNKEEKLPNPRSKANIFGIITFSWILGIIKKGLKQELDLIDLYEILNEDSSELLGNKLQKLWNDELLNSKQKNQKPSFFYTLFKMFGSTFMFWGIYITIVEIILCISISTIVGKIVEHFETNSSVGSLEIFLSISLVIILLMRIIIFSGYDMISSHLAMKMRISTCNLIYRKALRLKVNSLDQTSTGQILNLMSNDVNRFDTSLIYIPYLWIGPLETVIVTYLLWQEVSVSSLLGVATLVIFIPLQLWLGSKTSEIRLKTAKRTDERVHLMNEIILSLQVIKMYTWEQFFDELTKYSRKKEINKIKKSSYIKGILTSFEMFNTRIALFVTLFSYILFGNYITASKVFVITSYYNILRRSLTTTVPPGIGLTAELLVSIKRIEDFLLSEEKDTKLNNLIKAKNVDKNTINDNSKASHRITGESEAEQFSNFGVAFLNVTAKWAVTQANNTLENINITTTPNQLVAIIGPVGAGKSSLIQAILQELPLMKGSISVRGVVSYASQEPWLFSGSVKQNILFGSPMDLERYNTVIQVCALKPDLEQFPYGDRTIVGERGVSLSGGQKSRVNLARAIYKQADIYLLDDPLSAVDTRVGKHIFEKCITDYLKEKTCILITHQIQYLINVDHIVIMENAKVLAEGSYQELQKSSGSYFTKILGYSTGTPILNINDEIVVGKNNSDSMVKYSTRDSSHESILNPVTSSIKEIKTVNVNHTETHSTGNVPFSVYFTYILAGGNYCKVLGLFSVCILTQILSSGADYWITYWINLEENVFRTIESSVSDSSTSATDSSAELLTSWTASRQTCVIVFAVLTFLIIIAALVQSTILVSVCTKSSMNLHNRMFSSITRATMGFLNKTPSGRILNRFSKDIGLIDEMLPSVLISCIQIGLTAIGIVTIVGIVNPYLTLPTFVLVILFLKMRTFFMTTTRNIIRLEGVTRSPIYTHVNSSLQGLTTIRAFNVEQILIQEFTSHQDLHSSAWYLFITLSRAFGFWLNMACMFYISCVIFSFVLISDVTNGRYVGLAVTQSIVLSTMFQWVMRYSADLENQMTSVERVLEYTDVPQESALESTPDKLPPTDWPNNGQIIFKKLYLRYDLDKPFVLKNLNINIEAAEKVGIVGRTGAGKSSLIAALFRLAFNEGNIIIDGTMRNNLDPFDEYPDHVLWKALDEVELKDVVDDLSDGLNSKMYEGGSNFSVGQRQLVCLARAIIRNNKILVLDEATANVDPQTDSLIQNTIRNKFSKCTVLTIAHRLNTVVDSDKILVIDAGTVVEFDHPYNLLKNKDGFLYKMVEQTGQSNAQLLHSLAYASYTNAHMPISKHQSPSITEYED
ncbi:probable multidrug resistance-associated protein lethal(2)03659 isoform X2 [Metopolophium dirhodum]|uniref:probable multidrug resistance-associated protein lethal(2)03659 isoform X2 n=1 Tax=Metopolophium dirhodum TaxID=44670 RepID=UPI0029902CEA|nr:probable multidrug resistance-associated protein lethal(2)03659 isoform X2 [Metopolophium dirhodum]